MGEIRDLIEKVKTSLEEDKSNIFRQIRGFIANAESFDGLTHYLFHIDDRSWYSTYFHAVSGNEFLSEQELKTPKYLEEAVNQANSIGIDEEGDDESVFFEQTNDFFIDIISEGWKNADGVKLKTPCFITFHDSDYFYDIAKDEAFTEKQLEDIFK